MKVIPNWRDALRMYSVQAQALNFAIIGAWLAIDAASRAALRLAWLPGVAL